VDGVDLVERLGYVVAGVLCEPDGDAAERVLDGRSGRPLDTEALRTDGTAVAVRVHVGSADAPLTCCRIPAVFVYGTLLRGQSRHGAIRRHAPESTVPATCPGRLVELGAYPGLLLDSAGRRSTVHGELVRFPDATLAAAVARLDAIEDFRGFGVPGSLYVRRLVGVTRADGSTPLAWTYVYAGDVRAARPIASGAWRTRDGAG
jgi:gamma-glutamylcyclotransferase (GGCT)/AIG2-like uncharacterized protein YtfP